MIDTEWFREVLAEELDLDPAEIEELTDTTDLVELGVNSLKMINVSDRMARQGVRVHFSELLMDSTIGGWVKLAERAGDTDGERTIIDGGRIEGSVIGDAVGGEFPLGTMQHAYWWGRRDDQPLGGVAAHLYVEFDGSSGAVDPQQFAAALSTAARELVDRHPMLRTRILDSGCQRVMPVPSASPLVITDLRDCDPNKVASELDHVRHARSHQLLDLSEGEVWQPALTLLPDGRHRLHVDVDMVAADAMSYRRLTEDFALLAQRALEADGIAEAQDIARGGELPDLGVTYQDYRLDREQVLSDPDSAEHRRVAQDRDWWQDRIPTLPDPPELPFIPEDHREDPMASIRLAATIAPRDYRALQDYARHRGLTPAMVVATVFAGVLGAWSSGDRMLLNMPLFAREPIHQNIHNVVGDFTNSIVVGASTHPLMPFAQAVRELSREVRESAAHSAYTGLNVLRDMSRDRGHPVTANVVYTSGLDLGELFSPLVRELFGVPAHIISQGPQVDLDAQVVDMEDGLLVNWDVRRDCLPTGMVTEMFAAFTAVLRTLATQEAVWDRPLCIPLPQHQADIRREVNATNTTTDLSHPRTLHSPILTHAMAKPEAEALVWEPEKPENNSQQQSLSYGELVQQAGAIAAALQHRGVRPGDTVALQIPRGPHQVIAILGVLLSGAAYLPINVSQPDQRRETILADGEASLLLREEEVCQLISGDLPAVETAVHAAHSALEDPAGGPRSVAYVLFTSGSTGRPKGVEVSHAAAANTLDSITHRFALGDMSGAKNPPTTIALSAYDFDLSVLDLFLPLACGGRVVLLRAEQALDAMAWSRLIADHRVNVLNCAPGLIGMLQDVAEPKDLATLSVILTGGDRVPPALAHAMRRAIPGLTFVGLGGATEAAIHSTMQIVDDNLPSAFSTVPYGTPLDNVQMRVVDAAGGDAPDLVAGELWIGGASLAEGYRGDPERTADRFVTIDGYRWYRTGDMARYQPDGTVEFLGRRDNRVKIRGFRVELGEVESALEHLDAIEAATALVTSEGHLVAGIQPVAGEQPTEDEIRHRLLTLLPTHMVPQTVAIMESLPVTANGKKDRTAIARAVDQVKAASHVQEEVHGPDGPVQEALLYILSEVLGQPATNVTADFFELGGDSIQATAYTARVREFLGVRKMTIADVLEYPSVIALSERLASLEEDPGALLNSAELLVTLATGELP